MMTDGVKHKKKKQQCTGYGCSRNDSKRLRVITNNRQYNLCLLDFNNLPDTSRIWVYQSNRKFTPEELEYIQAKTAIF